MRTDPEQSGGSFPSRADLDWGGGRLSAPRFFGEAEDAARSDERAPVADVEALARIYGAFLARFFA